MPPDDTEYSDWMKVQRGRRNDDRRCDPARVKAGDKKEHSADRQQCHGGSEVFLKLNQSGKDRNNHGDGNQRVSQVVDFAFALLEEIREEKYESEFRQFRRLHRKAGELDPSMGIRRRRQKEDEDHQCHDDCQAGKHNRGMAVSVIVDLHHDKHHRKAEQGEDHLFE